MIRFLNVTAVVCSLGLAQPAPAPDKLPIRRVVLYKNGVGYFEHVGPVRDKQEVTVSFTSGQLNDVLKSLTVLDLNGGRITGVGYDSAPPADEQLRDLRLPLAQRTSMTQFLEAIRGARIEVKTGGATITGRLLSVERKTHTAGSAGVDVDYVSLVTETGEVRTTELLPSFSVRLLERGLPGKVDRYLDLAASPRDADVRRMIVSTDGSGERSLFLSYISEVPVWKATYRIVLNPKSGKNPLLQGWAIVDNTVGQDWDNVQLSLVAGAPQSFIQNLSQPFYARRPEIPLQQAAFTRPQTFQPTLIPGADIGGTVRDATGASIPGATITAFDSTGRMIASARADAQGVYRLSGLPNGPLRVQVAQPGYKLMVLQGVDISNGPISRDIELQIGVATETVTVAAAAERVNTSASSTGRNTGNGAQLGGNRGDGYPLLASPRPGTAEIVTARETSVPRATAGELGDLFEYKLKEPITIERNRSALVPIMQAPIAAEKVSLWNDRWSGGRPQRALWITNSSGVTLDGGSFSVLEEETFAGEGIFDAIRPNEKRLVSYAADLALHAGSRSAAGPQRFSRVRIAKGIMTRESEIREKKTYTFRNEDSSTRTVIVEHPVRSGYELRGDLKPAETTADWYRFRVNVDAKQTLSLEVEEARLLESTLEISSLTRDRFALLVNETAISPAIETALRKIVGEKTAIDALMSQKSHLEDESEKIFDDQQRLRENLKALTTATAEKTLVQRYTNQLNDQETRLEAIRKQTGDLEKRIDAAQEALDAEIQALSFDQKL